MKNTIGGAAMNKASLHVKLAGAGELRVDFDPHKTWIVSDADFDSPAAVVVVVNDGSNFAMLTLAPEVATSLLQQLSIAVAQFKPGDAAINN